MSHPIHFYDQVLISFLPFWSSILQVELGLGRKTEDLNLKVKLRALWNAQWLGRWS